jgi:hypothetical protein
MDLWWEELKNGSHRDQLSFDYVRWKTPECRFVFLDRSIFNNEYFKCEGKHKPIRENQNKQVIVPPIGTSPERKENMIASRSRYNICIEKENKISAVFFNRRK